MIESKLVNLLLESACVQGFVEVVDIQSDESLLNQIYGTDLKSDRALATGFIEMKTKSHGSFNFELPSINYPELAPTLSTPTSHLQEVPAMLLSFLRVRYYDVTRLAGWINGKQSSFKEDFYDNPDFWSAKPSNPHYPVQKSFYPKIVASRGFLETKLILRNTYAIRDSLWAARLFLDKVCFPNQLYLSLKVSVEGNLSDLTRLSVNKLSAAIEFLPFTDLSGAVLCQTKFEIE